jgi:cytochrome b6-f complex iron-sulfur subunit
MTEKTDTIDRKDFMKQVGLGFGAIMLLNCLQSCSETEIPDPNPTGNGDKLDFSIDITAMENTALQSKGGFLVIKSKNVIIARTLSDTWIAVSSACTHQGATINYRAASNDFYCPSHGSIFSSVGAVTKDPATSALKKYNATFTANSNTLRVFE